jgi:pimeloyl-ACP methyl ester carboxylesterase
VDRRESRDPRHAGHDGAHAAADPPDTAHKAMAGMFGWTTYDRLPHIEAPTLIIHGDQDVIIPVENAALLKERIRGAQLHVVKGAGHGYPAQDPVGVHQLVTDFFRAR